MAKKILIVDDDELLLGIYAANFKEVGFEVFTAHDGQEAWEMISAGNIPDLLFTGITMPRLTGFELIAKMQADPNLANIPVAINSHRGRPEDEKMAKEMNVDEFIIQGGTTPAEAVRRVTLLLGIKKVYKVALHVGTYDAAALIDLLNTQQGTFCDPKDVKEILLELEPKPEKNEFKVLISCNKKENN